MSRLLPILLSVLVLVGCASEPIYNVADHAVPAFTPKLTLEQVEAAIIQGGRLRGWTFERAGVGRLAATQSQPKYAATVDIAFTPDSYRITYKSSRGLEEMNGNIHSHYNFWVRNLDQDIENALRNARL